MRKKNTSFCNLALAENSITFISPGCMVHHAVYCLMAAFASGRMLVIDKADEIFGLEKGTFIYYVINFGGVEEVRNVKPF